VVKGRRVNQKSIGKVGHEEKKRELWVLDHPSMENGTRRCLLKAGKKPEEKRLASPTGAMERALGRIQGEKQGRSRPKSRNKGRDSLSQSTNPREGAEKSSQVPSFRGK